MDFTKDKYTEAISKSEITIYDTTRLDLKIPTPNLEIILNKYMKGISVEGYALRSRSKFIKQNVCSALGYPVPLNFKRTKPRFPGQNFDVYSQKSNNLQVWNEDIELERRYVIIRIGVNNKIEKVKVVSGNKLKELDNTGTLTKKYQARVRSETEQSVLVTEKDSDLLKSITKNGIKIDPEWSPVNFPESNQLISINDLYKKLESLNGKLIPNSGNDQERRRGDELHKKICEVLGYKYIDDGQFPDIMHQLLEVKLQTSPTIDLGLINPTCKKIMDIPKIEGKRVRYCDVRYAVFFGKSEDDNIKLTHFYLTTGEKFFQFSDQTGGKVSNKKIQIPLPAGFFD